MPGSVFTPGKRRLRASASAATMTTTTTTTTTTTATTAKVQPYGFGSIRNEKGASRNLVGATW